MKLNPEMKLPDSVNICGMIYPISVISGLRSSDDAETKVDGLFSRGPASIKIEGKLEDQERWQTFLHELIHGWLIMANIELEEEEKKVDALAYQAYCTLFNTDWKK